MQVVHLTPKALSSILEEFVEIANTHEKVVYEVMRLKVSGKSRCIDCFVHCIEALLSKISENVQTLSLIL